MDSSPDYRHYSVEDLLLNDSFCAYCLGSNKAAVAFWEQRLKDYPSEQKTAAEARKLYFFLNGQNTDTQFQNDAAAFRRQVQQLLHGKAAAEPAVVVPLRARWRRMAVAAAVAGLLVLCGWFLVGRDGGRQPSVAAVPKKKADDIAPGGDRAVLTLADGRQIVLDTAANGDLAQQGGIKVVKIGGQVTYDSESSSTEVLYNTITTPKGGQYQLELADGTKVWLNAASSLRFPTAFTGKERTVELTGEGYFEVAHNVQMPFHVKVNDMEVAVLGTHFNINAYGDEPAVKTTLLQGRVEVKKRSRQVFLNPGQQAIARAGAENIRVAYGVDVEEIVAWKNGQFLFNSVGIETIMKQIARWYDVDIEYEGQKQQKTFSGIVSRKSNLSEVLSIMKQAGVEFKVEDKKITVLE